MSPPISSTEPAAAKASTKENPRLPYATGSTGLAITVRGSSRRIMIMRFRPANIRLINRRSKLLRLLLALSSGKENANHQNKPTDLAQLTRSLHIRAWRSLSFGCDIGSDYLLIPFFGKLAPAGRLHLKRSFSCHSTHVRLRDASEMPQP